MTAATKISATLEDYLETIFALIEKNGEARVRDISERLSVHKSTVTAALKALAEKELVAHEPYGGATLTTAGRNIAERVSRNHAVVKIFLRDVLLVDSHTAETNACRMEHVMDKIVLERLIAFAEFMKACEGADSSCLERFANYAGIDIESNEEAP
jgi:DtxR family Mn-dependent transcriptional regulator